MSKNGEPDHLERNRVSLWATRLHSALGHRGWLLFKVSMFLAAVVLAMSLHLTSGDLLAALPGVLILTIFLAIVWTTRRAFRKPLPQRHKRLSRDRIALSVAAAVTVQAVAGITYWLLRASTMVAWTAAVAVWLLGYGLYLWLDRD